MNKVFFHKLLRVIYNLIAFSLLVFAFFSLAKGQMILYMNDYIFLAILVISFILVSKYSIKLKSTTLNFNDFIIIVCYMKFGIYLTLLFIFFSYALIFALEYKNSRKLNLLTENIYIFNNSIVILSTFISSILLNLLDKVYYIKNYETSAVVIFSLVLLSINYVLYCIELSLQKNTLVVITLENGLYYILLNFLLCTIIASFAVYLYRLYDYIPIAVMTVFIIFVSYSLNNIDKLRISNHSLRIVNECTSVLISTADFKVKLQRVVHACENIIPFVYCGIYFERNRYSYIYPITYKCNRITTTNDLKFLSNPDNFIYTEIMGGAILYKEASAFSNSLNIVKDNSKDIKYAIAIPIKTVDKPIGFMLLCLDRYMELDEEISLVSALVSNLGMINYHININLINNVITYKNYDGVIKYIDYNIKYKIFFTLALIEIENYNEIIEKYNRDFYETFKAELGRIISKFLSPSDSILCFDKEDIYIIFNLLDAENAKNKLEEISDFLLTFKFKDIPIDARLKFATSEYPIEGISSDEILDVAYRKLHHSRKAL